MGPLIPLSTPRLLLRPPAPEDAAAIFTHYASDPEVPRFLTWPPHASVEVTHGFLQLIQAGIDAGTDRVWALTPHEDPARVVGMIGLHAQRFGGIMMGFVLMRALWGQGFMTEAARAVLDHALQDPDIHRLWAICDVDNHASARVLEKIGMQREGLLRRFSNHPNQGPTPRDVYSYVRLRNDSPAPSSSSPAVSHTAA